MLTSIVTIIITNITIIMISITIIIMVYYTPKAYSNYSGPYITVQGAGFKQVERSGPKASSHMSGFGVVTSGLKVSFCLKVWGPGLKREWWHFGCEP